MLRNHKELCILAFVTFFFSSFVFFSRPIVNSDIIESIIDKDFKVISQKEPLLYDSKVLTSFYNVEVVEKKHSTPKLSFLIDGSHRIPIQYQERHGGLPIYLFKIVNYVIPKQMAHGVWHIFWRNLEIIFFYKFCVLFFSNSKWAFYTSLLYSINATHLFTNFVFISEPMNSAFIFLIIYWLQRDRGKDFQKAMVLTGLNFFIRLNFLWIAFLFVPYFFEKNKGRLLKGIGWVLVGGTPLILAVDIKGLLFESSLVSQSYNVIYLFESIYRSLYDSISYLSFYQDNKSGSIHNSLFLIFTSVSFSLFIVLTYLYKRKKNIRNLNLFKGFLLSIGTLYISVRAGINYDLYTQYLIPFFFIFFSSLIYELKGMKYFKIILVVCSLTVTFQTIETFISYYSFGPAQIFNFKHQKKVIDRLIETSRLEIVSLSERSLGKAEFLSDEKIEVNYIYPIIVEYNLNNISEVLMTYGRSGTLVVDKYDIWSNWYTQYGEFRIDDFYRNSSKYGILVRNVERIVNDEKEIYIIDYEIE